MSAKLWAENTGRRRKSSKMHAALLLGTLFALTGITSLDDLERFDV